MPLPLIREHTIALQQAFTEVHALVMTDGAS